MRFAWAPARPGFQDRVEAGRKLAARLSGYAGRTDLLVLAIPRGGVPVGLAVAEALEAPLDVIIVRKLGLPGQEELAMGAIASGGIRVLNPDVVDKLQIPEAVIGEVARREQAELERRELLYRAGRPARDPSGRTVIIVDDGLATGSTMLAAVTALRRRAAARIVVAVPVAPDTTCRKLQEVADELVCILRPEPFFGVGDWYEDFAPTSDQEVRRCLELAPRPAAARPFGTRAGRSRRLPSRAR